MISLTRKIIIAIDGYSSCGKSSFARLIASDLSYVHIDSGAMYRAIALFALKNQLFKNEYLDEAGLLNSLPDIDIRFKHEKGENQIYMNDINIEKEIREVEVSLAASVVSKNGKVREHLVGMQQLMGKDKGIVMDGRDIGTVVFPDAEIKIFMTAKTNVRVKRRYNELSSKGMNVSFKEVSENIKMRDKQDTTREISPLRKAKDAVVLDNSYMTFDEEMIWFKKLLVTRNLLTK